MVTSLYGLKSRPPAEPVPDPDPELEVGLGLGLGLDPEPPAQAPLSLYSGIVTVGADGTANISFDIPSFAGTVRVMAVAWSADKVGKASGDVTVRDNVVLTTTLPRFLRTGDRGSVQVELDNVEGAAGDYAITVATDGGIKRDGSIRGDRNEVTPVPHADHFLDWLQCLRSGATPNASIEAGYQHAIAVLMAQVAFETGRKALYDHPKRAITTV